ncbi:LemA family protein [Methylorubrum zatmanii]|uniref:LemA family protein n=1 Tax=Methylorubrum zatmanii TaxID=29429 RepID=A0ABW1WYE6_9HYPH|nr:LemA family protein [Methylorubrum zatmanii]MBD8905142.1 LemA family protein [Methylorubrum zatmanii]
MSLSFSPAVPARTSVLGRLVSALAALWLATCLSGCGALNRVPSLEEQAKSAWSEVQNQYQRRADLIPNLVETVKGYAKQEQDTLTRVTEARAKATSIQVDAGTVNDPEKFKQFQEAQNQLSGALGRLLASVEAYPDLKSNQNFLALQSQLEGTENRIAVARRDYIQAVQAYNTEIRTIPGRWIAGWFYPEAKPMETFTATAGSERAPNVKF